MIRCLGAAIWIGGCGGRAGVRAVALGMLAAALGSGCGGKTTAGAPLPVAAPEVLVATAMSKSLPEWVEAVGSLLPQEEVTVAPEVGGTVAEVGVDFGDRVERGTVLLRLDDRELKLRAEAARAALAQADAVLAQVRAAHQRALALRAQRLLAEEGFDAAVRELRVAEANREAAAKQLAIAEKHAADAVLRSPVAGYVAARLVSAGQYLPPYTPAVRLVVVDPLRVRFELPERFAGRIRAGQRLEVEVAGLSEKGLAGEVTRIGAALDPSTRSLPVEGELRNPEGKLRPGHFARVRLDLGMRLSVVVPRAALDTFAGVDRVYVVHPGGRLEMRPVVPASDLGEELAIAEGLRGGEIVAVSRLEELADGMVVQPVRDRGP